MTAQTANLAETLLEKLQVLAPDKQQQAIAFVEFLIDQQTKATASQAQSPDSSQEQRSPQPQRVFGQYRGQIWMSEDFDAPLPDEFWLGES